MNIYINRNGEQLGPYPLLEARRMVSSGSVSLDDMAWTEGLPKWVPLRSIRGFVNEDLGGQPIALDHSKLRHRPIAVWIICIIFFVMSPLSLLSIVMLPYLVSNSGAMPEAQRNVLAASMDTWHIAVKLVNLVLVLAWAIQLFRLKRSALPIYGAVLAWGILSLILQFTSGSIQTVASSGGAATMVGAIIGGIFGLSINLVLLWYTWHLHRTEVLR